MFFPPTNEVSNLNVGEILLNVMKSGLSLAVMTQTLSFAVGPHDNVTGRAMWEGIPEGYRRKQTYADGLNTYDSLIPYSQHWVAEKGSGGTNIAEGL